jgi:tetratricopeptide (TPR) repeat protein
MSDRRSRRRVLGWLRARGRRYGTARASRARADAARLRDPWHYVQRGRWLHDEGDTVAAHGAFARAIELDPKFAVAYHDMARNEFHCGYRGRSAKAAEILQTCARLVPDDSLTRALLAKEFERKGRLYDALGEIQVALALEADNSHYHCLHARILRRLGRLGAAEEAARRGLAFDDLPARMQAFGRQSLVTIWREYQWRAPTAPELRAELAEILAAKGDWEAAEVAARSALACARTDPERHHRLSEILAIRGRHDEAAATLEAAIALAEQDMRRPTPRDWPLTQRNRHVEASARRLSRILHAAGRANEATVVLRNALATVPDSGGIKDQLTAFLAERGADRAAAALLREATPERPEDAALRHRYSKVLQPIDLPEAIAQAEIAAMLEPDTPRCQDQLVKLLVAAGRTDDAARALARALPLNTHHGPLYVELSRLLQRLGRPEQALAAARRAVALEPERPSWQGHLAALLIEAGRPDEAEACIRQALRRGVESGAMYFRLSRLVQGRCPQEAIAAARRAVDLEPQQPYLRAHLVALLMEAGDEVEAEAALRDALERHPGHAALHFHHSRLWWRRGRPAAALAAARRAVKLEPERGSWRDHLAALLSEAGTLETTTPLACTTERASVLEFPAARSGRGLDGVAVGAPDCAIPARRAGPEHGAPQRG